MQHAAGGWLVGLLGVAADAHSLAPGTPRPMSSVEAVSTSTACKGHQMYHSRRLGGGARARFRRGQPGSEYALGLERKLYRQDKNTPTFFVFRARAAGVVLLSPQGPAAVPGNNTSFAGARRAPRAVPKIPIH